MGETITVIPALRYRNAAKAIDWLCDAFGFTKLLVVPGERDQITHSQLTYGNGMVMVGSAREDAFDKLVGPIAPGARATGSIHIVVEDVDGHHDQAVSCGAEILMAPEDQPFGGRFYMCRDLEGNIWSFGSYDPMA